MLLSRLKSLPRSYWNLSFLCFLFWISIATGSYLTVFLQKNGFGANQVGYVNAAIAVVSIMATPLWGMIADKIRSIRKIFILCISIGLVLWALVPASARVSAALIYTVLIIGAFFMRPANSLFDGFAVQRADLDGLAYGHVRLWGSLSYALMSLILGIVLPFTGVEFTFYIYGVFLLPLIFLLLKMKGADSARKTVKVNFRDMGFGRLFKNYYFITYLIFAIFVYMPMNALMVFLPYLIEAVGGDTARLGLLNACKAIIEIPILLLMRNFRRKVPLPVIVGGSALLFCMEAFFYSRAVNINQIMALQLFHGLGGGLLIGSASNYVYSLAPEGLNSTAHMVNGAVNSVASILGNLVGGFLITVIGIFSYYRFMSIVLFCAFVYFYLSIFFGLKILKKPIPSLRVF